MDISLSGSSANFIADMIRQGRFGSPSETVEEGLRLVKERETKLAAPRDHIDASLSDPEIQTEQEVSDNLDKLSAELANQGF